MVTTFDSESLLFDIFFPVVLETKSLEHQDINSDGLNTYEELTTAKQLR